MTPPRGPLVPHSKHTAQRSDQYHKEAVDMSRKRMDQGLHGSKAVERLNPTRYGPAVRSYPGLAN
jgi:hypothetical protein